MANRIQIRRGTAAQLPNKQVYQGELLWVTDEKKLYIGTTDGTVAGSFPKYENSQGVSVVKVISPDASEVKYNNTKIAVADRLAATTVQDAIDELATEKQNKLGGSTNEDGKAVIASSTAGVVTYREIDDSIGSGSDGSNHLVTANAAWDSLHALDLAKQDRPTTAVQNNIAIFDNGRNTIDSGKKFVTEVGAEGSDANIPTEKAVRSAISNAMTSAVNYKGARTESNLPVVGEKVGDYWTITDFDTSYPGQHRDGRAIWNGTDWDKVVDDFYGPDNDYIELTTSASGNDGVTADTPSGSTSSPKLTLKNQTRVDTTSTQTATFSGDVALVDSITTNAKGQVTSINVKTVTMPSLGKGSGQAAKGDEAEYTINKVTSIGPATGTGAATDVHYPTEKAVRSELDTKIDKVSNLNASTNYSLVNYNADGAVISGTDIIDGGTF